jgi:tungstate transport system ATP-binding protein
MISLASPETTTSVRNVFTGTVNKIVHLGLFTKVYLDCGFPLVASITNQSLETLALHPGCQVRAAFKATAVHVFRKD